MSQTNDIALSSPTIISIFIFILLLIVSIFASKSQKNKSSTMLRKGRRRYENDEEFEKAFEKVLGMKSIVSRMPGEGPRIPDRDSDYLRNRNVVLQNRLDQSKE